MSKYIVTIAPPTPNGNLHLGHIAGPFLAADIFARIRRLKKDEVFFTSYSDDYQDYVARKAIELGREKFELATFYGSRIKTTLDNININLDYFLNSYQNTHYKETIKGFYQEAYLKKAIEEEICSVPYSKTDNQYGYEAFAKGICNYCGAGSDASQCESCANSPVMEQMGILKSILSNEPMEYVEKKRVYLNLKKYVSHLKELYKENPIRPELRNFIDNVLKAEDFKWFIDRPDGNGIDITLDDTKKITIHTWFSGLAGYIAASKDYWNSKNQPQNHDYFWKDKTTKIVNFLGFDCSYSHAIVYPSLMSGYKDYTQNFTPLTNKFLKLEDGDFSTSRNNAIWVDDLLKEYSSDGIRFYLALISPEHKEKNFEMVKFQSWYTNFFENNVIKLKHILDKLTTLEVSYIELLNNLPEWLSDFYIKWEKYASLDHFSISMIADVLQNLLVHTIKLDEVGETNDAIKGALVYLILSKPVQPETSQKLMNNYKIDEEVIVNELIQNNLITLRN